MGQPDSSDRRDRGLERQTPGQVRTLVQGYFIGPNGRGLGIDCANASLGLQEIG